MARGGKITLNLSLLRMLLDLPEFITIVEVRQTPAECVLNVCQLIVGGPYCPEWQPGQELAQLQLFYRSVAPGSSELDHIDGLDT